MILTKQQEKDIKELIELAKQSDDEYETINIIPGIDFTCTFMDGDLEEWDFICTDEENEGIKSLVELLYSLTYENIEDFIDEHLEISRIKQKEKKKQDKINNLQDKILKSVPNLTRDLLNDTIYITQDIEELKKILKSSEVESKQKTFSDLEKTLEQIKDPDMKKKLIKILKQK